MINPSSLFSVFFLDPSGPSLTLLEKEVTADEIECLRKFVAELKSVRPGSNRAEQVQVAAIYNQGAYINGLSPDQSAVAPGHVFMSAAQASQHLGLHSRAVSNLFFHHKNDLEPPPEAPHAKPGSIALKGLILEKVRE